MTKRPMRSRNRLRSCRQWLLVEVNNSALRVYIVLAQMANVDTGHGRGPRTTRWPNARG